ncbi:ABC transporter permease subunit [Rhabdaerophilum sp. SD176]|uniref:ABC transporter permease subunit n=1 Tax=Rhabdaerophilum sp. SD176 TaxID=2983548 RepID=UPI0024DFBCC9|nr:ABC transporter permease subunit [Rhabdaerophilum sp. SD176]
METGTSLPGRGWPAPRWLVVGLPYAWLLAFFLLPFLIVLRIALSDTARALPPYAPHWTGWAEVWGFLQALDLESFATLIADTLYLDAYLSSLRLAATATLVALLIAFPLAYSMASAPRRWQPALLILVILPFWTSFLIRVYAWMAILRPEGVLDALLRGLGIIDEPLGLMNTETAVLIGMVYSYLPFMVLPIYTSLERLDRSLLEAAADLGATPFRRFISIVIPLARPGIYAGCFLVFIPAIGEFVIPDLLGGPETLMIGKVLWTEFFSNRDWPLASAVAILLLLILAVPLFAYQHFARKEAP